METKTTALDGRKRGNEMGSLVDQADRTEDFCIGQPNLISPKQ